MEDLLPPITIKPDTAPRDFIGRLHGLLQGSGKFDRDLHEDFLGEKGHLILEIIPLWESEHEDLYGQVICDPEYSGESVSIEIRARRWNPDPPNYDAYAHAAKQIFIPILKEYNKAYSTRLRMNIKSKESLEPKLSPKLKAAFHSFVVAANKSSLHPLDWRRFYSFVHVAHAYRSKLDDIQLSRILVKSGFTDDCAREIASVYQHGRELLALK